MKKIWKMPEIYDGISSFPPYFYRIEITRIVSKDGSPSCSLHDYLNPDKAREAFLSYLNCSIEEITEQNYGFKASAILSLSIMNSEGHTLAKLASCAVDSVSKMEFPRRGIQSRKEPGNEA